MLAAMSEPWAHSARDGFSPDSLIHQFWESARFQDAAALLARSGASLRLMKMLAECMLFAELEHHRLAEIERGNTRPGNYRNGSTPKTVATPLGALSLAVPRTRYATFVPRLIPRYQRRLSAFDSNLLVLYAKGLSSDALHAQLLRLYDADVLVELGDILTGEIVRFTAKWQRRRLERACALVHFDTMEARWPQNGEIAKATVLLAVCVGMDGQQDVTGFWIAEPEDSALLCKAMAELKDRGLAEPAMISGTGLSMLPDAAGRVFPSARFRCLRHDVGLGARGDKVFA